MQETLDVIEGASDQGLFYLFSQVESKHGLAILILILIILGMAFLLWKLVWRVWRATLKSKNDEIERLVAERNKYQDMVFDGLKSSRPYPPPDQSQDNGKETETE